MPDKPEDIVNDVIIVLRSLQEDSPQNVVNIYFSEKRTSKYISYAPQISNELQKKILELVIPPLIKALQWSSTVQYNPVAVLYEQNELIRAAQVSKVALFMESLNHDNLYMDMRLIKIRNISFYTIEIAYKGKKIYFFRNFTKMSRLRKGIMGQLINNELIELDKDFLGIDELTDMVLMDNNLLIINHISLERVFDYRDKFQEKTKQAIERIENAGVMNNVKQFSEDCLNDVRIMKRFTDLMSKERLPLFFDNYKKVPEIVSTLGLDIGFDADGKMIYKDKSQLFHIIHLMSDAYFRSLIAGRTGVAEMEGKL